MEPINTADEHINIDMLENTNENSEANNSNSRFTTGGPHHSGDVTTTPYVSDMIKVEVVDDQDKPYCHEKKAMSLELLLNGADAEDDFSPSDKDSKYASDGRSSPDTERLCMMQADYGTPPATPFSSQSAHPQRAVCSICKSESGRCHASDPGSMQTFFASSLGFEGVLSSADWLCMKCYSKWYNRCKRKAAAAAASNDQSLALVPVTTPPTSTPPRRKRAREGKDKERSHRRDRERQRERQLEMQREAEKESMDNDTDSDDALLLTRMTNNYHPTNNTIHNSINGINYRPETPTFATVTPVHTPPVHTPVPHRDLELEVDELHSELHRARAEMMRLAQEIARRDEQMEGMLKFVKTEMAAMHGLLKDIADVRWRGPLVHPPHPPVGGHVFHLNGKVLDNTTHIAANGCHMARPLTDALMHVQSN